MDCFTFEDFYEVDQPHHNHRRILQSFRTDYKVECIPNAQNIHSQIRLTILDAVNRISHLHMNTDDMLRVALETDAKDPIVVHSYYTHHNSLSFRRAIEKFTQQVHKVCQSTRCFTIGHSISVLVDRIAPRSEGSSCSDNYYKEYEVINDVNAIVPQEKEQKDENTFIYLPKKSSILTVKRYTFASKSNCLFQCLLLEVIRKNKNSDKHRGLKSLTADEFLSRNSFPFGYYELKVMKTRREMYQRWCEKSPATQIIDEELAQASVKFAYSISCPQMLDRPANIKHFNFVTQRLTKFNFRFALFDSSLNLITATENLQDTLIMLMLEDDHYHIIDSIQSKTHKLCKFCLFHHNKTHKHNCSKICHLCKRSECLFQPVSNEEVSCEKCNRVFRNESCKANHDQDKCSKVKCRYCKQVYLNNKLGFGHICTKFHCRVCGSVDDCLDHQCSLTGVTQNERIRLYQNTPRLEKNSDLDFDLEAEEKRISDCYEAKPLPPFDGRKAILIYYDIETVKLKTELTAAVCTTKKYPNVLIPAVICAQSECEGCVNDKSDNCDCQKINWTFYSTNDYDCVGLFIKKLLEYTDSKVKRQFYVTAHNGGRFDHHFLLKAITKYASSPELFIRRGNAVVGVRLQNITILDSYRFIPLSLRAMPKAIGLNIEISKDYFPHELTSIESLANGLSELPAKEHFGYYKMKENEKNEFDQWYSQQSSGQYDLKTVMVQYCQQDVKVLRLCCRKFIGNWFYRYGYNPFDSFTLPSTVVNSMIKTTPLAALIPLTPFHGYNRNKYTSLTCAAFLDVYEVIMTRKYNYPIVIQREVKLSPKFHADGVIRLNDGRISKVIEFLGCYYHFCDQCGYNTYRENFVTKKVILDADGNKKTLNYRLTKEDDEQIRLMKQRYCTQQGIEYIEFWEHELDCLPEEYQIMYQEKLQERRQQCPLKPIKHREALFGGRTEAFKLFHECSEDEVIEYHDVNGLYPHVLMEGRYPLMDPIFISPDQIKLPYDQFIGHLHKGQSRFAALVHCTVLPPQGLSLPVLPLRCHDKLFFALCKICADKGTKNCEHNEEERQFEVTVTSFELELALEYGYKITQIDSIEAYEVCAGPNDPGLPNPHREFVGKAMAMKQYAELTNNPSARFLAKLAANTYWGALGKNSDNLSTKFFEHIGSFYDFISSESINIKDVFSLGNCLKVNYRVKNDMIDTPKKTSLVSAIFVTSQARIKLYRYLRLVGAKRILYCDTDSVIWVRQKSDPIPFALSSTCGEMSDEVAKDFPNGYIHKFVSLGPKSYCYEIRDKETKNPLKSCIRMKGISFGGLNTGTSLSFDDMHDLLKGQMEEITLQQQSFQVDGRFSTLHHETFEKRVRVTMNKRVINEDYSTYPFGFDKMKNWETEMLLETKKGEKRQRTENYNILNQCTTPAKKHI